MGDSSIEQRPLGRQMDLLSYRGPNAPGSLSSALHALWNDPRSEVNAWWYLSNSQLHLSVSPHSPGTSRLLDNNLCQDHYRFCNELIWPLMHGFSQYCVLRPETLGAYLKLQGDVASVISRRREPIFVHDYQFCLIPDMVALPTSLFWHIPWPSAVDAKWGGFVSQISEAMSAAQHIGFQTSEYAQNYLSFLPEYMRRSVERKISVSPVPIDAEMWNCLASDCNELSTPELADVKVPIVLSVDRTDYVKGVKERLQAIDAFFACYPEYRGRICFVHVGARTRQGVDAYDRYWQECRGMYQTILSRWRTESWTPIVWIERNLDAQDLAKLYATSKVMLVTSLRDGLNLAAKEFVACQTSLDGVLVLPHAPGVSSQLGDFAVSITPTDMRSIVEGINEALCMPDAELMRRMDAMRRIVLNSSLPDWHRRFVLRPNKKLAPKKEYSEVGNATSE
jgi:trehalose-6-phosphate synthase